MSTEYAEQFKEAEANWAKCRYWLEGEFGPLETKWYGPGDYQSSIPGVELAEKGTLTPLSGHGATGEQSVASLFTQIAYHPVDAFVVKDGRRMSFYHKDSGFTALTFKS